MAMNRNKTISDQLRDILENCGQTRYRIAKATGISEPTLSRFTTGSRGLPMKTLDKLGLYLGLEIRVARRTAQAKGRKQKGG